ncbi:caspase family protein [Paraburkholderia fungorum]|uniref:Caspase family protein n=1 Tax=Paraburkholderia fungorum TaxID=134537 RepID=A0AAP5UXT6_9BURK|nr:caspase family protein [Paraburkholderia fungorum]MDT8840359.1 caspase family protein [Paraburkholderia fungorum]
MPGDVRIQDHHVIGGIRMSRRLTALVIGNAAYDGAGKLKNPAHDAADIALQLEVCGFTVIKKTDCSNRGMDQALRAFKATLSSSDVALFFFAGHGMQIEGENYLLPLDVDTTDEVEAKHSSLALSRVIDIMERGQNPTSIIILDACRNNPFERSLTRSKKTRGLAPVYAPKGTLIAYATSPSQVASDGRGRNGAYTAALLQHISAPDCSIENMFKRVRNSLSAATGGKQISWEHTSLAGEFYFNLSLGARIDEYADDALSDSLFIVDEKKASHRIIRALKSNNWYTQNDGIEDFTANVVKGASPNSLFVVGRNIYQAACGGSRDAFAYIAGFAERAQGFADAKRKAILDGMLFEVFFGPKAELRKEFKTGAFQSLFALQVHKVLAPSFAFIAECLLPNIGRFYALPGKSQRVVVDVSSRPAAKNRSHILESIHCDGESILWLEDPDYELDPGEDPAREKLRIKSFEQRLSEQMMVPAHLLTINYLSFERTDDDIVYFAYGWTARKP